MLMQRSVSVALPLRLYSSSLRMGYPVCRMSCGSRYSLMRRGATVMRIHCRRKQRRMAGSRSCKHRCIQPANEKSRNRVYMYTFTTSSRRPVSPLPPRPSSTLPCGPIRSKDIHPYSASAAFNESHKARQPDRACGARRRANRRRSDARSLVVH